jgi:hypothetical protein
MTDERRWPIPDHPGYETDGVDFYGIYRVITKRDGVRYTVKGRKLKISAHRPSGLPVVKLSSGRAGKGRWCYVHLLLAATFGEAAPANTNPPPANSSKLDSTMQPLQQAPANSNGW